MKTTTTRNSIPRSWWTAPSLRADRRRIYAMLAVISDLAGAGFVYLGVSGTDFYEAPAFWVRVVTVVAVLAVIRVAAYALLVRGRAGAFNLARDRALVESGEITIDEAAERFASWPQRRVWHEGKRTTGYPVLTSMGSSAGSGPGFITSRTKLGRLRGTNANSFRWVDVNDQLRSEHQSKIVINGLSGNEWLLPFPQFGSHSVPPGYAGRSRDMIAKDAEKAKKQEAHDQAERYRQSRLDEAAAQRELAAQERKEQAEARDAAFAAAQEERRRQSAEREAQLVADREQRELQRARRDQELADQKAAREEQVRATKPVLQAYAGNLPPSIAEVLAATVDKRSEISNVFVAWSGLPGTKPKLTALVDAPLNRFGMAAEVARALNGVDGGSKLAVRALDPVEVGPAHLLETVTFD